MMNSKELNLRKLISYIFKNHKNSSIFLLLIFIFSSFLESFSFVTLIPIISIILKKDFDNNFISFFFNEKLNLDINFLFQDVEKFFLIVLSVYFIRMCSILYCNWYKEKFAFQINHSVVNKIYFRYINLKYDNFIKYNSSLFLRKLHYDAGLFSSAIVHSLTLLFEIFVLIGISSLLILLNFQLSITLGAVSLIILFIVNFMTKERITNLASQIVVDEKKRYQNAFESFSLFKEIKLFNNQNYFLDKNKKITYDFFYNDFLKRFIISCPRLIVEFIIVFGFLSFVFIVKNSENTTYLFETLTLVGLAVMRLLPAVNRIISSLQTLKSCGPSTNNVLQDLSEEKKESIQEETDKLIIKKVDSLIFENAHFTHKSSNKTILNNFNFKFFKGKIYGIRGDTGSGKTTLINLICGLLELQQGKILINNINLLKFKSSNYQNLIGYVPQKINLMDTTIEENILFGEKKVNKEELQNAVSVACLTEYLTTLPKGIQTRVGEQNSKISGGQSQRVGIARALLKDKDVLILDESTNSLDNETEKKILENIKKLKHDKIILFISHDEKNFEICDEVLDISSN